MCGIFKSHSQYRGLYIIRPFITLNCITHPNLGECQDKPKKWKT